MKNSKIEWCDHTFNPWIGCTKVSPGCQHCYAEVLMDGRFGRVQWGPQGERKRTSAANWRKPLAWDKQAKKEGIRYRVFCASLADVFEDRPELDNWRIELFDLISATPNLDWLILTKRPENINPFLFEERHGFGDYWPNVMFGTSVENQEQAEKRIPALLKVENHRLFVSIEPLLGPVDFNAIRYGNYFMNPLTQRYVEGRPLMNSQDGTWTGFGMSSFGKIHWVIVGGESGPHARPMHPDWVRNLRDQCQAAGVPFLFKQWGEWLPNAQEVGCYQPGANYNAEHTMIGDYAMAKVGKHAAGRLLDGREWNEYPSPRCRDS